MDGWTQITIERWELRRGDRLAAVIQRDVTLWRWVASDTCGVTRELRAAMLAADWVLDRASPALERPLKESA